MIQRIQSLYLFLIPVVILIMFFIPLITYTVSVDSISEICDVSLWMKGAVWNGCNTFPSVQSWIIPALGVLTAILPLVVIFQYKNRKKQLKLNRYFFIVSILFLAAVFSFDRLFLSSMAIFSTQYHIGAYLALAPLALSNLANRSIRKDEAKVRAADRLR